MSMNKILFVALLASTPTAFAAEQPTGGFDGFVAGAVGGTQSNSRWYNVSSTSNDFSGSVAYTDSSKFGGQLDYVNFEQDFARPLQYKSEARDIAGHLYYREENWLLGAFAQTREFNEIFRLATKEEFIAIEGQVYRDNIVLYGQLGTEKWITPWLVAEGPFISASLSYFVDDNLRVTGKIDGVHEVGHAYAYDQTNYGLSVEYRMASSPVSVFASYLKIDETDSYSWRMSTDLVMIGAKFSFGKGSLKESVRQGAGLTPAPRLIQFGGVM